MKVQNERKEKSGGLEGLLWEYSVIVLTPTFHKELKESGSLMPTEL